MSPLSKTTALLLFSQLLITIIVGMVNADGASSSTVAEIYKGRYGWMGTGFGQFKANKLWEKIKNLYKSICNLLFLDASVSIGPTVFITGVIAGIGLEFVKQLVEHPGVEYITIIRFVSSVVLMDLCFSTPLSQKHTVSSVECQAFFKLFFEHDGSSTLNTHRTTFCIVG
jgi:hypothetical protein